MTQFIDYTRRSFAKMDVLSHLGETLCVEVPEPARVRKRAPRLAGPKTPAPEPVLRTVEEPEEYERWDGLA